RREHARAQHDILCGRRLIGAVRPPADARYEEHADARGRGEDLRVVPRAARHVARFDPCRARGASQGLRHALVQRDGRPIAERVYLDAELALAPDDLADLLDLGDELGALAVVAVARIHAEAR